jgi:glycine/D-amino acid oxidase-like deaminating enzyme
MGKPAKGTKVTHGKSGRHGVTTGGMVGHLIGVLFAGDKKPTFVQPSSVHRSGGLLSRLFKR